MSALTDALAAVKSRMLSAQAEKSAVQSRPSPEITAEMEELGIDVGSAQDAESARREESIRITMRKIALQSQLSRVERNCGTCVRWKTCSILHRKGLVSPSLCACSAYETKVEK